ncbi:MAG: 5-(carboxyamino)imidazole ribonucleotide synthase [Brumimicrobium sp.]|nr:5-(carboxyamino)imidazole ribonucleotide synthase [Brumimicrobium sp.]
MDTIWYGDSYKLGVLGGGQLGRMLIQSAISYDVRIYSMDDSMSAPCARIAHSYTKGNIMDYDDVVNFGRDKDVLTVEIEHVNVDALEFLESQGVKVFPRPSILRMIQDKGLQKEFYRKNNIPTAPYRLIENRGELEDHKDFFPAMQKMRKGGYDGKGVTKIGSPDEIDQGFDTPSVLEKLIDFEKELSVIVARNEQGEIATFPLVECEFSPVLNLVEFLFSPAEVSETVENKARKIAVDLVEKLDFVGLLAVELFLTDSGDILVNEIAPRTHNSGHHTIECNFTSQFEQHLRAITNQPLGNTDLRTPGVMVNLLGEPGYNGPVRYDGLDEVMKQRGVYVHVYGKEETKPHRKMGHVTITHESLIEAKTIAREIKNTLKVRSR